jgi:hypothetical protein
MAQWTCPDPPKLDEVMRSLPDDPIGKSPFIAEYKRDNVHLTVEPTVDTQDECRFYPLVGPARLRKCHYKCTVSFDRTILSEWPIPFKHVDRCKEVVYIDHDQLIACAGPAPAR